MKKRFQNILGQTGQKRGLFLLVLAVCMTLVLGMMTGCTAAQTESSENVDVPGSQAQRTKEEEALQGTDPSGPDQAQGGTGDVQWQGDQAQGGSGEMQSLKDQVQGESGEMQSQDDLMQTDQEDSQNSGGRPVLSEDAMEIGDIASDFSRAYFDGDQEELRKYLADSYDGDIEIYPDAEPKVAGMTAVKGLEDIGESQIGDTQVVSLECDRANTGEGLLYLTLEMVKQENGWKVYFYGLEM